MNTTFRIRVLWGFFCIWYVVLSYSSLHPIQDAFLILNKIMHSLWIASCNLGGREHLEVKSPEVFYLSGMSICDCFTPFKGSTNSLSGAPYTIVFITNLNHSDAGSL